MSIYDEDFATHLDQAAAAGLARSMRDRAPAGPGRIQEDGRVLVDLSSNDYLGLGTHKLLAARAADYARRFGTGSGASRLVTGTRIVHRRLEARIAIWKRQQAALLFGSGWQANAAVLPVLLQAGPGPAAVFADRLIHASLHHGIRAAGLRQYRFRHNDMDHLDYLLRLHAPAAARRFILTESVFSMEGDRAPLADLVALARRHEAFLYVDEAHASGVLGPDGAGLAAEQGSGIDLVMGTFSKALGSYGAYVAGSRMLIDYLVQACSGFIHTTAPPPPILGAIDAALDLLPALQGARDHLRTLAEAMRGALHAAGFETGASSTQIVPVLLHTPDRAIAAADRLHRAGYLAVAIRPPTVPPGTSRLRLALSAAHTHDMVAGVAAALS